MKVKKIVMFFSLVLMTGATFINFKKIKSPQAHKKISLCLDSMFSKKTQENLILFAKEQEKMSFTPQILSSIVKDRFAAVDKVIVQRRPGGKVKLVVVPHVFQAVVNEKYLLTQSRRLIPIDDIEKGNVFSLPTVTIVKKDQEILEVSQECQNFIQALQASSYKDYSVKWINKNNIELSNKKEKEIKLLATHDTVLSDALFEHCQKLKTQGAHTKLAGNRQWCIDVRFKNQIIIFAQKGERA